MKIIEISALENGAHRNQEGTFESIPAGWVAIPEDMPIPESFPFVNLIIEGEELKGMTEGVMPKPEPVEEDFETLALEMLIDHDFRLMLLEEFGGDI